MATAAALVLPSADFYIKNTDEFERKVRERLNWSRNQWVSAGESGNRWNKLSNSLSYWKSKLKPAIEEKSIIITLFNEEKDVRTDLFRIVEAIEKLDCNVIVQGFTDFRNPRYICIYFNSKEERDKVKCKFRMLDNDFVVYMSWALEVGDTTTLKVHWLPMTLDTQIIKNELDKYVMFIEEHRNVVNFMSGRELASGKITFKVKVKKEARVEVIPHVMNIAGMEALITIKGREALCLNCDTLGHISRDCKMRFCKICNRLKPKVHQCQAAPTDQTYAEKVKKSLDREDLDDLNEPIIIDYSTKLETHELLGVKIDGLEKQLSALQAQEQEQKKLRLEKKRKAEIMASAGGVKSDLAESLASSDSEGSYGSWSMQEESLPDTEGQMEIVENKKSIVITENIDIDKQRKKKSKKKQSSEVAIASRPTGSLESSSQGRSYGKPNPNNDRKRREDEKFNKASNQREFIFKD